MKKLLQINPVIRLNTSTGRIMQEIGELVMQHGWDSYIAYSRGRDGIKPCQSKLIPVGNRWSVGYHGMMTRLFDCHGLASDGATRQFIREIEQLQPDIIHIHNIHGYFLNYQILFEYLSQSSAHVIWTVHDCWLYTGHCYHYSFAGCSKWKTGCRECPQQRKFPASLLFDRSQQNFADKRAAFTSIPKDKLVIVPVSEWIRNEMQSSFLKDYPFRVIHNGINTEVKRAAFTSIPKDKLVIVPVSEWIRNEMQSSFLKDYPFRVIHNGINTEVFNLFDTQAVKEKYQLQGKHILLGVASIWSKEKGLDDFIQMASLLKEDEQIVLVGVDEKTQKQLPANIRSIRRTENVRQLAELYAAADAFINPTWQDNYPTVNLESIACGTPVVTYRTGGSLSIPPGRTTTPP